MPRLSLPPSALLLLGLSACAAEPLSGEELASQSQALYGGITFNSTCSPEQRATATDGHQAGMGIAMSDAFDACVRKRVFDTYKPCDGDAFEDSTRLTQYEKARDILRGGNLGVVSVTCSDLAPGILGQTVTDHYGDTLETLELSRSWLDTTRVNGVNDWERAGVGAVIWHEAMHQQDYSHDACGYPADEYQPGTHSMPAIADQCMYAAGITGRAAVFAGDAMQSLGVGRHLASRGDLSLVGDNRIATLHLGPATRLRYCRNEGSDGSGSTCNTLENLDAMFGPLHRVPDEFASAISFVEVTPLVVLYSGTDYRGNAQGFSLGEFRAINGELAGVGNDQTRSIYVAPGTRVRVCSDEGGPAGHGYWSCASYGRSLPAGVLAGISYLEVQPVVTAFTERNAYGAEAGFGPGRWAGAALAPLGEDAIRALVVPEGLVARVCTDAGASLQGAGTCMSFSRTSFDLGVPLAGAVSFLEVSPAPLGTYTLQLNRPQSSGPTRVTSAPLGIDCTGLCSYGFAVRSEVKLSAAATATAPEWTGCDRVSGRDCFVTMTSNRAVSVNFPTRDQGCYRECFDECILGGDMLPRQCVQMCTRACTN
jgi:hypothetical protein